MKKNEFLSEEDLQDIFAQLDEIEVEEEFVDEEVIASQKRYEDIIKKHKKDQK